MKKTFSYPDVSVVVVNHNGKRYLEKCLSSLKHLDYKKEKLQIVMVDNCSTDGSSNFVKRQFPGVRVLHNDINNYAKANNIGIKSSDGEFVALLNNDTYVDKNWLSELINVTKKHQRIGCAGSKVLFPDGRIQSAGHYEFPNFYWGDRGLREPDIGQYDFSEEVSSLSGASVLFRRKCLEEVGFLDEDFVMYLEDVDLFLRCRDKEWKLVYAPKSIVYHEFHGTADNKLVNYYIERNRLLLIAKHFPEKLSDALIGKGYFVHDKDAAFHNEIYSILPEVFTKLLNAHGRKTMHILMPNIFENLKKLDNLKKDAVVQSLNSEQENLKNIIQEKDNQKTQIEEAYKQESSALSTKNQELSDKLNQLEMTAKEISGQKTQIEESYEKEKKEILIQKNIADRTLTKIGENVKNKIEENAILSTKNLELSDKLNQKEILFDNLVREISEKSSFIKDLFVQKSSIEQELRIRIEDFYRKKEEADAEIRCLKTENIKNKAIIEEKGKELNNMQTLIQNLSFQLGNIKRETELLKEKNIEKDMLIRDIDLKRQKLEQELSDANKLINNQKAEIENYKNSINRLEAQKNDFYNSETYRFIVKPVWNFLDLIKPKTHGFKNIFSHVFRNSLLLIIVFLFSVFIAIPLKIRKFFKF